MPGTHERSAVYEPIAVWIALFLGREEIAMNRRQVTTAMVIGGAALAAGQRSARQPHALAGGWASLELINPLQVVVVGVPAVVDAQVLQHGVNPSTWVPAAIRFLHEDTGEEQMARLEVISESLAIVRGEVTLSQPGAYGMHTWEMGPEIALGRVQAIAPAEGEMISRLHTTPETAVACSAGNTAGEITTEILDGSFAEPLLEVAVGRTVTWVNTSIVPHQVVFDGGVFDSSAMLHQDDSFSITFGEPGEFGYYCGPHPYMTGVVRVAETE